MDQTVELRHSRSYEAVPGPVRADIDVALAYQVQLALTPPIHQMRFCLGQFRYDRYYPEYYPASG